MVTNRYHGFSGRGDSAFGQIEQGAGRQQTGACGAQVTIGTRLLFACAFFSILSPPDLWASTQAPRPAATAFAYSISHTVKPLPDAVFEKIATPEVGSIDGDDSAASEIHEPSVDARVGATRPLSRNGLCSAVASVAKANNLPVPFFANLIWQESNFNTKTISRAGALGIAQFMPKTANEFGLINPFEPIHALNVAGKFVSDLYKQFGNLGLAAAAYNAGPRRVTAWMAKRGELPGETRAYVLKITGRPAEDWTAPGIKTDIEATLLPAKAPCVEVADAVKAQAKTVHAAKLMMELAQAATETRDRKDTGAGNDNDIGPVAEASWRTRALRMVRVVLQRLNEKQEAARVAAKSVKKAIKIAAQQMSQDDDKAPGRNARRSVAKLIDTKSAVSKPTDKGTIRVALREPERAETTVKVETRPSEAKLSEAKSSETKPELKSAAEDKADTKAETKEAAKPVVKHRRAVRSSVYAYSSNYGRPY
jgi:hypothetical protein